MDGVEKETYLQSAILCKLFPLILLQVSCLHSGGCVSRASSALVPTASTSAAHSMSTVSTRYGTFDNLTYLNGPLYQVRVFYKYKFNALNQTTKFEALFHGQIHTQLPCKFIQRH